ncbi:MAG: ArgR family transcriptional regulator, partial [Spirochaetales bacterium]
MNERDNRLKTIRGIIGSSRIASQEQLLGLLEAQGWSITQATLSRDLKALQVAKVPGGEGGYYYTLSGKGNGNTDEEPAGELVEDFRRGFISLAFSGNLGIVRTLAGHAN